MNNQTEINKFLKSETIKNNSDILFIYDARMSNPNGDPDDENKPRMDYNRNINLVSDVRLKRYIRDYFINFKEKQIFVSKVDGETVDATKRLKKLIEYNEDEIKKNENLKDLFNNKEEPNEKNLANHLPWLLSKLIDVRFFGATMPLKSEVGKGASITFTGPIQFNWGYSLNKISGPMDSCTITSTFAGAGEEYSTIGKDFRVAYSIIAFHGIISASRAVLTNLTDSDINLLDEAMIYAIPLEATTRSKVGQCPQLYIRIEYNTPGFFLGDLRNCLKIVNNDNKEIEFNDTTYFKSCKDYKLDLTELSTKIKEHDNNIYRINIWKNQDFNINGWDINNKKLTIINT